MAMSKNDVFNMLVVDDGVVSVDFAVKHTLTSIETMRDTVLQRIAEGKKPAQKLSRLLDSLALQLERAQHSVKELVNTYNTMTTTVPRQRISAAFKARKEMLESMTPKVLKEFAKAYIDDADEYIMPDDADMLRTRVLDAMSEASKAVEAGAE